MSFSSYHLFFDDVPVGSEFESQGRTVTESDIVTFAGLSGDFNPIHMDHEFARKTPYRRPIAHGLGIFSIASGLAVSCPPMRTIAFLRVREWNFLEPVFIGDTIRMRSKLIEVSPRGRGRRAELQWHRLIVNQDGKHVQDGYTFTLVEGRALVRGAPSGAAVAGAAEPAAEESA